MPSNDSPTPANRPAQRSSSRASPSSGTGRSSPALDIDTKYQPPRLTGTAMSLVPRLPTPGSVSASASANNSTNSSRETSPIRLTSRVVSNSNYQTGPSRSLSRTKNSNSPSPSRGASGTQPNPTSTVTSTLSPAAVQKAFAQLGKPDLQRSAITDKNLDASDPDRASMPPPRTSRRRSSITNGSRSPSLGSTTTKRSDPTTESLANISTKRTSVSPEEDRVSPVKAVYDDAEISSRRPSGRGATQPGTVLETVQESSVPSTPVSAPASSVLENAPSKATDTAQHAVESGSESGGNKSSGSKEDKRRSSVTTRPTAAILPQKSFTSLNSGRGKPSDGSVRNMIVETETVSSIPQVSLGVGAGERGSSARNDQGGTIRMKPSVETIRPKKEKKRTTRKPANPPGAASSKADIFEAKVASAIDDADVSDSDETFVYESNPPEPLPNRHRYHSRTPSATSMASQAEQFASRSRLAGRDGTGVTVKRSMKFTNNHNNNLDSDLGDMDQRGVSGRGESNGHSGRHHIGRHGRGGGYPSLFDSDSPFPQSQQPPRSPRHYITNGFRQSRRGNGPRSHPNYRTLGGPKSMSDEYTDDFDADGADDERTPLVSSVRMSRNRNGRRPGSASMRQMEYLENRQRSCFSRYGGCVIATFLIVILIGGAATFLAALMRPLLDVQVTKLSNVLASEQEIMVDVHVSAINPNIFPISIANMDVNIFARSRYVGSDKLWRDHGSHASDFPRVQRSKIRASLARLVRLPLLGDSKVSTSEIHTMDGIDHGTDPLPFPDDPSGDAQTMLLGRVFSFDSPVIIDPSPWRRIPSESVGEIRLPKPGNKTEEGGTERWERVLQHPFELIVRGVFKYSLPLTSGERSASISARVQVLPNQDDDSDGNGSEDGNSGIPGLPRNETVRIN
ncbi:phospholipid metabolism enzyme regulator, putative [Talaromyces stipitatus ATCC 10500]|uniref:Phospholipid metabolism enzyme regulator, putative n=1 Tax=Talaromyces stipitatus (strain ATCC 10500 / CBS 375.48 / QM 6759 / NRRL 1006) TaxID=441959 RepID=B8M1D5_TALSN|nr:phospholipid metabolism enzyme regulator, putative [Talaromyces stipitatus ATCC 10500]EED21831.1 phospholipid metabolism enzyme regulator, putative [Talaromyces stipitatus ATCC 10500]